MSTGKIKQPIDDGRWDNILDRFEDPEAVKAQILSRKKSSDPYPEGLREIVMDVYYNRCNGSLKLTAQYTGMPYMTVRGWALANERVNAKDVPIERFFVEQATYQIPRLKRAVLQAVESIPNKLAKAGLGETLRYIPRINKLIQQLEAGELPHDLELQDNRKGPNVAKAVKEALTPNEPPADDDVEAILAKAEARLGGEAAN